MKTKNMMKAILFFSGLFIVMCAVSYLLIPYNSVENGLYKKNSSILNEPRNTIDYVTIGDSECSTSISPMEIWDAYGYTGYNCGLPAQRLQDTYYLLEKLLKKQSPKVVLLETNAFYRDFKYISALETSFEETAKNIFPVYKYHNNWKYFHLYMLKAIGQKVKQDPVTVYKGYLHSSTVTPYKNGPYVKETSDVLEIGEQPLFYLNKIEELCREKNNELILYSAPSPKCWTYSKHNSSAAYAKENQLAYLDLNLDIDALNIDWLQDTRDGGDHMNYYGAKKVSAYLGKYLYEHAKLKDHREEEKFAGWNREMKNYIKMTQQN